MGFNFQVEDEARRCAAEALEAERQKQDDTWNLGFWGRMCFFWEPLHHPLLWLEYI